MNRQRALWWIRPIVFLLLVAAIFYAWKVYRDTPPILANYFPFLQRDLQPLYAIDRADHMPSPYGQLVHLRESPARERFLTAVATFVIAMTLLLLSLARRWRTTICLLIALCVVSAINVTIASIPRGYDSLTEPMSRERLEYYPEVHWVKDDPIKFLQEYPTITRYMGVHPGTHPPGGILFLWAGGKAVDRVIEWTTPMREKFLGPPTTKPANPKNPFGFLWGEKPPPPPKTTGESLDAAAWLAIGFTTLAVLPAFWLAQLVGGAASARRMLPIYASAPNLVLYGATSMDGVFLTFSLFALAAGVWALQKRTLFRPIVAGAALWVGCLMTFTLVLVPTLLGIYAVVTSLRRPARGEGMLARCFWIGVVFIACQGLAQWLLGYDFIATAIAAIERDHLAMRVTGYETFELWRNLSLANLIAWAMGSGVVLIALYIMSLTTGFRQRKRFAFTLAVGACALAAAVSTLFTLETERVWLMLTPAVAIAATPALRGWVMWLIVPTLLIAQAFYIEVNYRIYW